MKKGISDFLKLAYKYNKVKNLEEAFKEFPVTKEWHKGKIENILKDNEELYNRIYKVGDIVYVKEYSYSNKKRGYNHLFVIIEQNILVPMENFCMLISSNLQKLKYKQNIYLEKDNINNLKNDSIVKTDNIYIIENDQILFKIGRVDMNKIKQYKMLFKNNLL